MSPAEAHKRGKKKMGERLTDGQGQGSFVPFYSVVKQKKMGKMYENSKSTQSYWSISDM